MKIYKHFFKRFLDLSLSITGILGLLPLMLFIYLLLLMRHGNPMFLQSRVGCMNRIFTLYKFCTMDQSRDKNGDLLPDRDRITPLGRFLRNTSLDELPQLFNVLKGEMSLVGPRPLLVDYLPRYKDWQKRRHEVRPGITGWAQVNGRNALDWETKFRLDVWYVEHLSFWLDLKILLLTFVRRGGINKQDSAEGTMDEYKGE